MNHDPQYNDETFKPDTVSTSTKSKSDYLITEANFKLLITTLDNIYTQTQVRPSLKKLVNLIIDKSDIEEIEQQLIRQYT